MSNRAFLSVLAVLCIGFVGFGSSGLDRSGIQTDEALFSSALYPPFNSNLQVRIFNNGFSLMVMPYVGALKAYVWAPVLAVWGPSAVPVRLPALLLAAVSIWLFGLLGRRVSGEWPALGACALLATDPMYLLTARWDWGPVVIQHVCFTGAMLGFVHYHQTLRRRSLWAASILCGLGLWDKATFAWLLSGMAVAALPWLYQHRKAGGIFMAGVLVGSLPLVVYNIRSDGGTFKAGEGWTTADMARKASVLQRVSQGSGLHGYIAREGDHRRNSGFLWLLIACGGAGCFRKRTRPIVAFALFAGFIAWLWMAFLRGAGDGTHHAILLWPLPHLIIAAGLAAIPWRIGAVLVLLTASSQAYNGVVYLSNEAESGSRSPWSDASYQLPEAVAKMQPASVCVIDWGFTDTLRLLGTGRFDLCYADVPSPVARLRKEANVYITHTPGEEVFAGSTDRFLADASRQGYAPVDWLILKDRHGRPMIAVFRLRRR